MSDQTGSVGANAAFTLEVDVETGATKASKALVARALTPRAGPALGVIGAVIDTGFTIRDIEEQYGFGFEATAEDAYAQSDDFETCIAAGNEDSIFISKD